MKPVLYILFLSLILTGLPGATAQSAPPVVHNPPVGMETLFSNRGVYYQMLVNKKLQSLPKLGFFSVTSLVGEWDRQEISDLMTQGNVTYEVVKGLNLSAGFHVTPGTGFKPSAGLMYSNAGPEWLLVVNPRIDLVDKGSLEGLVLVEYKPRINEHWRYYSRVQGLYAHTPSNGDHARSYLLLRAGFGYKEFTFGLGANVDNYGPLKHNENSIGGFLSLQL